MRVFRLALLLSAAVLLLASPDRAAAQVCGDADGNGSVTVTDGVQALRSAAGLSSSCTAAACDVDGNGSTTVTDGVNVLRKAAGLSSPDACTGGGAINQEVQDLIQEIQPFLSLGLGFIPAGGAQAQQSFCDNVEDGGEAIFGEGSIEFFECQIGDFLFDGGIFTSASSVEFDVFSITDLTTDEFVDFNGVLTFGSQGGVEILNGNLEFFTSTTGDSFAFAFNAIAFDPNSQTITGGSVRLDADFTTEAGVTFLELGFNGTNVLPVTVGLEDGSEQSFTFDQNTGILTPA
jgi:hypothetical protein